MVAWVCGVVRLHLPLGDPLKAGPLQRSPRRDVPRAHRDDHVTGLWVRSPALRNEGADQGAPEALAACRWVADQVVNAQRPGRQRTDRSELVDVLRVRGDRVALY